MEMKYNYHCHTYRCRHAVGTSEDLIKRAIECGFSDLGISEHMPHPTKPYNMSMEESKEYISELKELKEKYKDKINVYIGFECEYFEGEDDFYLDFFKQGVDYLILGNHHTHEYNFWQMPQGEAKYKAYLDNMEKALKTGFFTYVAHPDLVLIDEKCDDLTDPKILKVFDDLINLSIKYDTPLEINCEGYRDRPFVTSSGRKSAKYPRIEYIDALASNRCKVIIGSDSHNPMNLKDSVTDYMYELANEKGIKLLDHLELKNPLK